MKKEKNNLITLADLELQISCPAKKKNNKNK